MKNNLKKIVAGLCALTMIPCLSVYAENTSLIMSAKAGSPFISINDENNDIIFDESQISVTFEEIEPFTLTKTGRNMNIEHNTSNNIIKGSFSGPKFVDRISFEVEASDTSVDVLKEKAYMGIESTKLINGEKNTGGTNGGVSECEKKGENTYILHFYTGVNGDSYKFQIQGLDDVDNLSVISYTVSNDYTYKVEATCPDGDGICAYLHKSEGLNVDNMTKWAKNQCLLANSLKHIANNPGYDTVYYYFNGAARAAEALDITWINDNDKSVTMKSGVVRYSKGLADDELELIKLNSNAYNYFTMHELSHVYNKNTNFDKYFNFADDFVANTRALTALQNCENIRSYNVRKRNNNANDKYEMFTYGEVYSVNANKKKNDDYIYYFAKNILEYFGWSEIEPNSERCDWSKIETFYKAECASEYDLNDTIDIAKKLADTLGVNIENLDSDRIEGKKERYLKFVNMLRWLYSISEDMEYNDDNFINFINDTFAIEKAGLTGLECIKKTLIQEKISDPVIKSAIATNGSYVKTVVEAASDALEYQWYLCEPGEDKFIKSSRTQDAYICDMIPAKDGRKVYCEVTYKGGKTKSNIATLYMGNPLTITTQPVNTSAEYGQEVKVRVAAKGDGLTYKWYYKNKGESKFYYTKTFDDKTLYSAEMNEVRDGRQIYCEIKDKYGFKIQTDIVTIGLPVEITKDLVDVTAKLGEKVNFSVSATGHGLTYKWYFKNKNMKNFEVTETFKTNKYGFDQMTEARAGREVYCEITDIFGNKRTTETIKINLLGDANCDGVIDAKDADAILKAYANSDKNALTPQGEKNADFSGDGVVTPDDALGILQYLSN